MLCELVSLGADDERGRFYSQFKEHNASYKRAYSKLDLFFKTVSNSSMRTQKVFFQATFRRSRLGQESINYFLYLILLGFIVGGTSCQTGKIQKVENKANPLVIQYREGRLEFEDLVKKKKQKVKVEAFILQNQKMRLEATATLGIRVASILVSESDIQAQLYLEKKFLSGKFPYVWKNENPTLRSMSIPLSPKFLQSLILKQQVLSSSWKCEKTLDDAKECLNMKPQKNLPERITWVKSSDGEELVFVESETFRIKWTFLSAKEISEPKPKLFEMQINENYQKVDITPR